MRPATRFIGSIIGYFCISFAIPDVDFIGPVGVSFSATRSIRDIRLHQRLIPLQNIWIHCAPLPEVTPARICNQTIENTEIKDDTLHPSRSPAFSGDIA